MRACSPGILDVEEGRSAVEGHLCLHSEFSSMPGWAIKVKKKRGSRACEKVHLLQSLKTRVQSKNPHGRKGELTPSSCHLTYTYALWHGKCMCICVHKHRHIH